MTDPLESTRKTSGETTINTAGGAYVGGDVFAEAFVGRDLYNYYFIGLAPLVHDPTRRFRNFLNEYLGTPARPVPFGGRQTQLDELHAWLNKPDAPPYYLMTAEAGRGKSALLCRWMEQLRQQREDVAVVFIPISIRFETAAQDVVFAALAARLAKLYDESLKPAALSGAQWQGVCESYLDRSPPAGKQLLVILDGLDEATGWSIGAGFFSTSPPAGLRVLVTARLRVGERTPQGWAATLGWSDHLTRMATLLPLTPAGLEEALISMGNPLDKLANKQTVIKQLYYLSEEGDPLLVKLYIDALVAKGPQAAFLSVEDLAHLKPGLDEYFKHWWEGQKTQWKADGRNPLRAEQGVLHLLNLLSAAQGPLTKTDLGECAPEQFTDGILLDEWLTDIGRWVIGDGVEQGYTFSHPRFGYYFWAKMLPRQRQALDRRFCAWGATTLDALNAEKLDPKAAPVYLLRHYANHLQRSHASAEAFYALVSNGWRKAWEELDVSCGGFLGDVDRAWERAKQAYDANQLGRADALVQQVRAALCRASVAALGSNMTGDAIVQMVDVGLHTSVQALAIVKLVPNEEEQSEMLAVLAPHLSVNLMIEALELVRSFRDLCIRTRTLLALVLYVSDTQRPLLIEETFISACTIGNEYDRVKMLSELVLLIPESQRSQVIAEIVKAVNMIHEPYGFANTFKRFAPYLTERLMEEALTAARAMKDESYRVEALSGLVPYLPERLIEEALIVINEINNEYYRALTLSKLVPRLSEDNQAKVVIGALTSVRAIKSMRFQAEALIWFVPYIPENQLAMMLTEVLTTIRAIDKVSFGDGPPLPPGHISAELSKEPAYFRVELLSRLASHLTESQRASVTIEALTDVQSLGTNEIQFSDMLGALIKLVPHLSDNQRMQAIPEALKALPATVFWNESHKADWLGKLAPHLPTALLGEALACAREFKDIRWRVHTLLRFAPHLSQDLRSPVLIEVFKSARMILDGYSRAKLFSVLTPYLPERLLEEMLTDACAIDHESSRAKLLGVLARYLPESLLDRALMSACMLEDERARADALSELAPHLPERLMEQALKSACTIKNKVLLVRNLGVNDDYPRARTLGKLAPHLSYRLLEEMLSVVCAFEDESSFVADLRAVAPHLPKVLMKKALTAAYTLKDVHYYEKNESPRSAALVSLAPYLPAELLSEAFSAARSIQHEGDRATALIRFTPHLPAELRQMMLGEALTAALSFQSDYPRADALASLVPHLPAMLMGEALTVARSFQYEDFRARALSSLVPHLPTELLSEALSAARSIQYEDFRAAALVSLVPHLPVELHQMVLSEALTAARSIKAEHSRADALVSFVPHLPTELSQTVLSEALSAVRSIQNESFRANALGSLAPHLPMEQCQTVLGEALTIACSIKYDEYESSHAETLGNLVKPLESWFQATPVSAFSAWVESLSMLASRPRPEFLRDLTALMPFILALAGDEAPASGGRHLPRHPGSLCVVAVEPTTNSESSEFVTIEVSRVIV